MMPLNYTTSSSEKDLIGILDLQKNNIAANLSMEEAVSQGFVTVIHTLNDLKKMNEIEQHIICKENDKVIAYLLSMTTYSKYDIPVLLPMFEVFEKILFKEKLLSSYNYIVVGQVCVDKEYRGKGILDKCYEKYKQILKPKYDFALTEIASRNMRSINAHKRIGFSEIHQYISPNSEQWSIVVWEW